MASGPITSWEIDGDAKQQKEKQTIVNNLKKKEQDINAAIQKKINSVTVSTFSPSICHGVMGPVAMMLVFGMSSFQPPFSFSSFIFIKRPLSSSSLSAIRVVSSAYPRLLIFLLAILIPACNSSSIWS